MKKLQSALEKKIKNGEYTIGKLIVPQKFIKIALCDNRIENEKVEITGRKIGITYIWTKPPQKKKMKKKRKIHTKKI